MVSKCVQSRKVNMYSVQNRNKMHGGEMMQAARDLGVCYTSDEAVSEQPPIRTKFNISMEKKIERLWQESDRQGWSYGRFVSTVMEVLTVLHHRNKLVRAKPADKKLPAKGRSMSESLHSQKRLSLPKN